MGHFKFNIKCKLKMPKTQRGSLTFRRRIIQIPLKFKKAYAEIFLKDLMFYAFSFDEFSTIIFCPF